MLYEDLRLIHEDIERLEQAVADRVLEEPQNIRSRLVRDHEISNFLARIQSQSERALKVYEEDQALRTREIQHISTGDTFQSFDDELKRIREFHRRYPNEPAENLERAYKRTDESRLRSAMEVDGMFTGEEGFGRFFDLTMLHEEYLNLPGVKGVRKPTYLQYLDVFDAFAPPKCILTHQDKMTDQYFSYLGSLAHYLESFMRRTRPLEDLDKLFKTFDEDFEQQWKSNSIAGWEPVTATETQAPTTTEGTGTGIWCADCQKEFSNQNVYASHLTGKKHLKNAASRQEQANPAPSAPQSDVTNNAARVKDHAVASRESRIHKLASAMQTSREDTRVNVERKAGMTDKERQQELEALYEADLLSIANLSSLPNSSSATNGGGANGGPGEAVAGEEADGAEKIWNPLKLPLAWDGKPIPFWLFKLHGLGVEFPCEICGNFVYMGRRAFDKHFSEQRHIRGLECLGITKHAGLFREITTIADAEKLWEKIERDRLKEMDRKGGWDGLGVVEMEDKQGNVMPKKVYDDLLKAGVL